MADEQLNEKPKRRLRNAETVRERALKAQEEAGKPRRRLALPPAVGTAAAKPARGIARIFRYQPFRFIGKAFRFVGRFPLLRYFAGSWRELRLVTWPNRRQTRQLTVAVLLFAVVFGALVSLVDYGLDKLFKEVLLK